MPTQEQVQNLREAMAEYLGVEVEKVRGYVLGVEHINEAGALQFSSVWAAESDWRVSGFIDELEQEHKQQRARQSFESIFEPAPE